MNSRCSYERLERALAGALNADDEVTLHLHLEECESCVAEMARLSGGEQASREVAAMLIPDDFFAAAPLREECSTSDVVVDHLEPSDDPVILGRLGGYDILDIIGRGGMGVVLKGFDRELKRFVAIKALAPHLAHSPLARKRFAREAQAAAAVVNLHVIAIHQVQPSGQLPFLVMPLLTGESLAQRLKARGTLELQEILRIGMQAAEGLAAAHGQGLIHRDVKPANILLEKGVERAVLTDFGLARAADDVSMTRWGIIAGTPEYMSPEQARGEALDDRSDLFGLGCVLYEMATGVSPFRTDSTMATLRRIVDEQPAAMASLVPELPPWFCHIVERLLSKEPAQRFASASEVSELLEQCLSHLQQPTSVPLPTSLLSRAAGCRSIFTVSRKGVLAMLGTLGITLFGMVLLQATEAPDIRGQWTSDEWGTVVLEAKGPGEYEGTFTSPGKNTIRSSDRLMSGPDGLPGSLKIGVPALGPIPTDGTFFFRVGLDRGTADKDKSGTVHLKWSRVERRFNGTWGKNNDRSGKLSLRLVGNEIRGGWTTDKEAQLEFGTPLLGDLLWTRSSDLTAKHADLELVMDKELRYRTKANPEWRPIPLVGVGKLLKDDQTVVIYCKDSVSYEWVHEIIRSASQRKDVSVTVVRKDPEATALSNPVPATGRKMPKEAGHRLEEAIRNRKAIQEEYAAILDDLELQISAAQAEVDAAKESADNYEIMYKAAEVSKKKHADAQLRLKQATLALERLRVRYSLYKKAGADAASNAPPNTTEPKSTQPSTESQKLVTLPTDKISADAAALLILDRLGVTFAAELVKGVPAPFRGGLPIAEVIENGPAAKGGLRKGDTLVGLHKWETLSLGDVAHVLRAPEIQTNQDGVLSVRAFVIRDGETLSADIALIKSQH